MKAKWTPFAQQKRKETARYLAAVFGRKAAMNFHQNIREWVGHITCYPGIPVSVLMSLCWSNVPKDSAALLCIGIASWYIM